MSLFQENYLRAVLPYPVKNYPEHWQVIYAEAMKSHHLLFDPDDIKRFNRIRQTTFVPRDKDMNEMEVIALSIFKAANIPDMKRAIRALPFEKRELAFYFYLRAIKTWRDNIRNQLN